MLNLVENDMIYGEREQWPRRATHGKDEPLQERVGIPSWSVAVFQ